MTAGHSAAAAFVLGAVLCLSAPTQMGAESSPAETATSRVPRDSPTPAPSVQPGAASHLETVAVRLENARTVKVLTSIFGIELGSKLEEAHAHLDKLSDPATPPKEEQEEAEKQGEVAEHKVLWRFAGTDYKALFVKTDDKERITYITGFLRPGKEQPFAQIGELSKAPIRSDSQVAWDVVRPDRPLFRVVASGGQGKANTISLFVVKRPQRETQSVEAGTPPPPDPRPSPSSPKPR